MAKRSTIRTAWAAFLLLLVFVTPVLAGPPLVCFPFDIGDAHSLPWTSSASTWDLSGRENYDTHNLVRDTLAILDANAPVVVRMETLRRAALYARKDQQAGKELVTKIYARTTAAHPGALAWFDAGYLAATCHQLFGRTGSDPAAGIDGYALVARALSLRGDDPQMEFAAALMTFQGPEAEHARHLQKARAGAKTDPLLARNLAGRPLGNDQKASAAPSTVVNGGAAQ